MASLLDRSPRDIRPDDLLAFLGEKHVESERLDYKRDLNKTIAETLVAMANTQGGLIIAGVAEKDQLPASWPGLGGKDWIDTLGNHNAIECLPPVRYEAHPVYLSESDGPLLVVRVPAALRKPHMSRTSGVLVRVGTQNRPPTLEQLAGWFSARGSGGGPSASTPGEIPYFAPIEPADALNLSVLAWPVFEIVLLPMSESTDSQIERLLRTRAPGSWQLKSRGATYISYQTSDGSGKADVHANGQAMVQAVWPMKRVPMFGLMSTVAVALCFQLKLLREVFSYADDIAVRMSVANLSDIEFEWTSSMVRLEALGPSLPRYARDFVLTDASGIEDEVVRTAMQVCRQAQLVGYESQVLGVVDMLKVQTGFPSCV